MCVCVKSVRRTTLFFSLFLSPSLSLSLSLFHTHYLSIFLSNYLYGKFPVTNLMTDHPRHPHLGVKNMKIQGKILKKSGKDQMTLRDPIQPLGVFFSVFLEPKYPVLQLGAPLAAYRSARPHSLPSCSARPPRSA